MSDDDLDEDDIAALSAAAEVFQAEERAAIQQLRDRGHRVREIGVTANLQAEGYTVVCGACGTVGKSREPLPVGKIGLCPVCTRRVVDGG